MASDSATSSALLPAAAAAPPPSTSAFGHDRSAPSPALTPSDSLSASTSTADASAPPSPPSLAEVQRQSAVLSDQLRALVLSVHARSRQYVELTSVYQSLLSTAVEAAVSDAELCADKAQQLLEATEGMNVELQQLDEVERVVKRTLRQVEELERKVTRMKRDHA